MTWTSHEEYSIQLDYRSCVLFYGVIFAKPGGTSVSLPVELMDHVVPGFQYGLPTYILSFETNLIPLLCHCTSHLDAPYLSSVIPLAIVKLSKGMELEYKFWKNLYESFNQPCNLRCRHSLFLCRKKILWLFQIATPSIKFFKVFLTSLCILQGNKNSYG